MLWAATGTGGTGLYRLWLRVLPLCVRPTTHSEALGARVTSHKGMSPPPADRRGGSRGTVAQTPEFVNLCLGEQIQCHTVTFLMKIARVIKKRERESESLLACKQLCVTPVWDFQKEDSLMGRDCAPLNFWASDKECDRHIGSSVPAYTLLSFPSLLWL